MAIDHITLGLSRLAFQFSESTRLRGLISAIMAQGNDLEAAHESTIVGRAVATAVSAQLDVIGVIVGIGRTIFDVNTYGFFAFDDDPDATTLGFGELDVPLMGGIFAELDPYYGLVGREMNDDEYRVKIYAQILRNNAIGNVDDIANSVQLLIPPPSGLGAVAVYVQEVPKFAAYSAGTTYGPKDYVTDGGIDYRSKVQNGSAWTASTVKTLGNYIRPSYESATVSRKCTTAGTTGTTEPIWPTTMGATVTDGTVVWTVEGNTGNTPSSSPTYWETFREWNSGISYFFGGVMVKSGGLHYISRTTTTIGHAPASYPAEWKALGDANIAVFIARTLSTGEQQFLESSKLVPVPMGMKIVYTGTP